MKIQLVFNHRDRLADPSMSIRYERYIEGFRELGHDVSMITTVASAEGVNWAETVPDTRSLFDPLLWARLSPDLVLLPTWLGMADLLAAIRPHARHVIVLADSDGYVGSRVHPWRSLSRKLAMERSLEGKLRAAGWWVRQYLGADRSVDQGVVDSCRLCDRVVVFSPGAKANLHAFFRFHRVDELAARVLVAPFPVDESFEASPVATHREDQILAIGRWADPQKAAGLLADTLAELVRRREASKVIVIGSGGEAVFGPLARACPSRVDYRGVVPQAEVLELFDQSQVLLSTSRWESGPIVAAEAVLRGCSVVGAKSIPGFRQFSDTGCGTVFATRSPRAVANAVREEAQAWRDGRRDPNVIAAAWRGYFTPRQVCAAPREPECWRLSPPRIAGSKLEAGPLVFCSFSAKR